MTDEEKRIQLINDYKGTFGTPEGLRVLADLAIRCRFKDVLLPTGGDGHIDPYQVVGYSAMRILYVGILKMVEADLMKKHDLQTDNTQEQL